MFWFRAPLLTCFILLLMLSGAATAQNPGDMLWEDRYIDVNNIASIAHAEDGTFVHASTDDTQILMNWVDVDGNLLNTATFTGTGWVNVLKIVEYSAGGYILVGKTNGTSPEDGHAWVVRTDADGVVQWQQSWAYGDNDEASGVVVDDDGSIVVTGRVGDMVLGYSGFLWKLTPDGTTVFQYTFGGHSDDFAQDVILGIGGGYLLMGRTYSMGAGGADGWLLKSDVDGNVEWQQAYGTPSTEMLSCAVIQDGAYVLGGKKGGGFTTEAWILSVSEDGTFLWEEMFGESGWNGFNRLMIGGDGNIGFCGFFQGWDSTWFLWVGELDPAGSMVWQRMHGLPLTISCTGLDFRSVDGGGYLVCGQGNNTGWLVGIYDDADPPAGPFAVTAFSVQDPLVIPGEGGQFRWVASIENISDDPQTFNAWTEALLPNGNTVGPLQQVNGLTLMPGASFQLAPWQNVPGAAPAGDYTWYLKVGDGNDVLGQDSFDFNKLDIPTGASIYKDWSYDGWDFTADIAASNVSPSDYSLMSIYPNPFNAQATVSIQLPESADLTVTLFNVAGQEVSELTRGVHSAGMHAFTIDAFSLSSGLYFVRATVPGHMNEIQRVMLIR
jgi:Secretion system C-terminal sorting domain